MVSTPITSLDVASWGGAARLDRCEALRRNPEALAVLWADPRSRVVDIDADQTFSREPFGSSTRGPLTSDVIFVGQVDGQSWFARRSGPVQGDSLRTAVLTEAQTQIVAAAAAALNWHSSARHCELCGARLEPSLGGFASYCRACQRPVFPRTDPAIIVAVLDADDRIFLAHQPTWPPGRISILAGFLEVGESAENAVHREVGEETRLTLSAVRYLASQPWTFPRSLMLGYVARGFGEGLVDGVELEWGSWFSRAELESRLDAGEVMIAAPGSIARRLIDSWRVGRLPAPEG